MHLAEVARIEEQIAMPSATITTQCPSVTVRRSQDTLQPAQRGISRRTVLLRLAGLTVVGIASSSLVLLACSEPPALTSPPASPTSRSVPTSLSVGTTLYTYRGHSAGVNAVVWSPDGKRIASGSQDQTVQVWDAPDGSHVYIYRGHSSFVNAVAWSSDGQRIASGSNDKTVQVWDAADGSHIYTYRGHSSTVNTVAWNPVRETGILPDGQRIASGSDDGTVQVWNAADGSHVYIYRRHSSAVNAVAWSPMISASPRGVTMGRCRSGTPPMVATSIPIAGIPLL